MYMHAFDRDTRSNHVLGMFVLVNKRVYGIMIHSVQGTGHGDASSSSLK